MIFILILIIVDMNQTTLKITRFFRFWLTLTLIIIHMPVFPSSNADTLVPLLYGSVPAL